MDTSSIPVDISALYNVLLSCAGIYASLWGLNKVVQYVKKKWGSS